MVKFLLQSKRQTLFAVGALWLAVGLVYFNSLWGGFLTLYDDGALVTGNPWIKDADFKGMARLFTTFSGILEYLPLRDLTYLLDYRIWGLNPIGFHLTNILIYALCVIAVFRFCLLLTDFLGWKREEPYRFWVPFVTALLFALHPAHTESVAAISGRKDVLSGLFFFLSLETFLRFELSNRTRKGFIALSLFFFCLAFLSKASVMVLPLMILLLLAFSGLPGRDRWVARFPISWLAGYFFIAALFIRLNWSVAQSVASAGYSGRNFLVIQAATAFEAFLYYLKILLWPFALRVKYGFGYADVQWDARLLTAVLAVATIVMTAILVRKRHPAVLFSFLWFALSVWPFLGLITTATLIADRYLFIPSFAFCWIAAETLYLYSDKKRWVASIFAGIVIAFAAYSIQRNFVWYDEVFLWRDAASKEPNLPFIREMLAQTLWNKGRKEEALEMLKESEDRVKSPFFYDLFMGRYLLEQGNADGALQRFKTAEPKASYYFSYLQDLYLLMGKSYERKGDLETAAEYYLKQRDSSPRSGLPVEALWFDPPTQQAVEALDRIRRRYAARIQQAGLSAESRPRDIEAQFQLGYLYDILGMYDEAMIQYQKAAIIDPRHPYPRVNMGLVFFKRRDYDRAVREYRTALDLGAPDPASIYNFIGICYKYLFDFGRAEEAFKKAIELEPNYYDPYANLAAVYEMKKEKEKAAEVLEKGKTVTMRSGYRHGR